MMNRLGRVTMGVFVLFALGGLCVATQHQLNQERKKRIVTPKPLCSDFVCSLNVNKSNNGVVILTGDICNEGPGNYSNTVSPLEAYFVVITWHPPKTASMEGDLKIYARTDMGTSIKAKEHRHFRHQLTIDKFSRWGEFPTSATERQAFKEFTVKVERKNGSGFSNCEDSNNTNTFMSVVVPYMEKITK